jgi:preprotein translocase subunit SecE
MEFLKRVQQFFHEVAAEFRRVNWPSRTEVTRSTVVVLAVVIVLAVYLWAVDVALSWPVERLLRLRVGG